MLHRCDNCKENPRSDYSTPDGMCYISAWCADCIEDWINEKDEMDWHPPVAQ